MQGDFSHRIEVRGKDQLAELGVSFNRMTENLAHLLTVAKEKERLQSEIEIAREVQKTEMSPVAGVELLRVEKNVVGGRSGIGLSGEIRNVRDAHFFIDDEIVDDGKVLCRCLRERRL